jgi:hypothetical protein
MNLDNKAERGSYKMAICKEWNLAAFQWCDSRVVNCVSSLLDFREATIQRQVGSDRKRFTCPAALVHYQQNMGGVDKGDQMRSHFGGFAAQSHFKKWYKKTVMAVLDCMLLNAINLWNMSATDRMPSRNSLKRYEFLQAIAFELLNWTTNSLMSPLTSPVTQQATWNGTIEEYHRHKIVMIDYGKRCQVCCLENTQLLSLARKHVGQRNYKRVQEVVNESFKGLRQHVAYCDECCVYAHNTIPKNSRNIHTLFPGKSCMEILHSRMGKEIWNIQQTKRKRNSVKYNHPLIKELRMLNENFLSEV